MELPVIGLHFVFGPLLALLLVALLGGLLRWTYGTHKQHVTPYSEASTDHDSDLGLLREVAVVPTPGDADVLRRLLAAGGIRTTVRLTTDGIGRSILVFAEDENAARGVLAKTDLTEL